MEFCPDCKNKISITFEKTDNNYKVIHVCNNCNYSVNKTSTVKENSCMYYNPHNIDKLKYYIKHKDNIKYDPTIPHIDIIPCPNKDCISASSDVRNDVLYINLDDTQYIYLYICNYCNSHWTNSK